jgi:hypothetical protein
MTTLIIIALLLAVCAYFVWLAIEHAPIGYEDEDEEGFHYGEPPE